MNKCGKCGKEVREVYVTEQGLLCLDCALAVPGVPERYPHMAWKQGAVKRAAANFAKGVERDS